MRWRKEKFSTPAGNRTTVVQPVENEESWFPDDYYINLCAFIFPSMRTICLTYFIFLDLITSILFGEDNT
jgi:hypothetical protein